MPSVKHDDVSQRLECISLDLRRRNQDHVLRWWTDLDDQHRHELLDDLESLDWTLLDSLVESHVRTRPVLTPPCDLRPADVFSHQPRTDQMALYDQAVRRGRELLAVGKVAAFTVAGGQGTRLGVDGPKGCVVVTPIGEITLFELFAQMIVAVQRRYGGAIPWYIMTSPANHGQTVVFFEKHDYFGLPRADVTFFPQGMLPVFDFQGRLLLESKSHLAMAPDGHGGSLKALVTSGALKDMQRRGIEIISYFQVDNPLVKPFDPLFIGLHSLTSSEMSTKVSAKVDDLERVGNVCMSDGKLTVIEYSDFPEKLAQAKNPDGSRMFDAGNLAIHLINVSFVDRVVARSFQLPFRRAEKSVAFIDEKGMQQRPNTPNAIKLETFVFDVLPFAKNPLVLEVDRAEEFSPVKNATGADSLESSTRDQVKRASRWLERAGVNVPLDRNGNPTNSVFIAPTFALDAEDVVSKRDQIRTIGPGKPVYLA